MLTYKDCLDWCDLDQSEVDAISEYEKMDHILALAFGQQLAQRAGPRKIRKIILEAIRHAQRQQNLFRAAELKRVLQQYIKTHPV